MERDIQKLFPPSPKRLERVKQLHAAGNEYVELCTDDNEDCYKVYWPSAEGDTKIMRQQAMICIHTGKVLGYMWQKDNVGEGTRKLHEHIDRRIRYLLTNK